MSALERLRRLQRLLRMTLAARAMLIACAVAIVLFLILRVALSSELSAAVAIAAAAAVIARPLLQLRMLRSLTTVALWMEEQVPTLRYALVSAAEGGTSPRLEQQAMAVAWWKDASPPLQRAMLWPSLAFLAAIALAVWNPLGRISVDLGTRSSAVGATAHLAADVLSGLRATVTPPAYTGRAATSVDDPTSIEAVVGSAVSLTGNGDAERVTATVDSAAKSVAARSSGWSLGLTMPAKPTVIRLRASDGRERLVVLAPIADAIPSVILSLPAHDTIVRVARGGMKLRADVRDDIGLRDGWFEIVISSGGGENFTFRSGTVARASLAGRMESTLEARLSLDSLKLRPGDILQLRAVARDGNTVTGPGVGASETRALRVARADEYDSLSIEALPPPEAETQALSQRMLINLTEALVKRRRALTRDVFVLESRKLAVEQRKLRQKVGDIVFSRLGGEPLTEEGSDEPEGGGKLTPEDILRMADSVTSTAGVVMDVEGDETPILALNKPLLEAFNAMWDAGRALEIGEPANAIPPMRAALAAIERARLAERIYLRGRTRTPIVDIPRVRLSGKDKGKASIREARVPPDATARRRSATFERVTTIMASNPDAAADSLLLMRVDALTDAPQLATALDEAARALRRRDSAALPLAWTRVRRALGGAPIQRGGLSVWMATQ